MPTQWIFCKKEDWNKISIPNNEYEMWFYENYVEIDSLFPINEPKFPFYETSCDIGDELIYIKIYDGDKYVNLNMSVEIKTMTNETLSKFFGMDDAFIHILSFCRNVYGCAMSYKTNRNFEREKLLSDLFMQTVDEDEW